MSMISSAIPNLVQGISQQSPALRLSSSGRTTRECISITG